jgi:phosphate binding protein
MDLDARGFEQDGEFDASLISDQATELGAASIGLASSNAPDSQGSSAAPLGPTNPSAASPGSIAPGAPPPDGKDTGPESRWIGKRLSHFRLMRVIGRGSMGVVFQVEDIYLKRICALKILRRRIDGQERNIQVDRFMFEARTVASLDHPNVAQVYEINQHEGWWFIAMEFLEGGSLQHVLTNAGPLPPGRAALMLADAARGLAAAHEAGLIHRDVKPGNLMLTRRGRCKVVDFGLVKADSADNPFRDDTSILGTPLYIAPEIVQRKGASPASDVYSIGATLFMLLTGSPVFKGADIKSVMRQHVEAEPPDVRTLAPNVPQTLAMLIRESLSKVPERRPTAEAFAAALQSEVTEAAGIGAAPATGSYRTDSSMYGPGMSPSAVGHSSARSGTGFGDVTIREAPPAKSRRAALMWAIAGVATCIVAATALIATLRGSQPSPANKLPALSQPKATVNSIDMRLVQLPTGSFTMGSPADEPGRQMDERQTRVGITRPILIGATEVTQGQWAAVMGADYTPPEGVHPNEETGLRFLGPDLPAYVSWFEASEFCRKLGLKEGKRYRLPTEAEWEYACRAGTAATFNTGGNLDRKHANIDAEAGAALDRRPYRVASFSPNAWGLYDMHGNLMEWCSDWLGDYALGPVDDPSGASEGELRVLRGGSWDTPATLARSANRWANYPVVRTDYIGFRVVMEPGAGPIDAPSFLAGARAAEAHHHPEAHHTDNAPAAAPIDAALPNYTPADVVSQSVRSVGSDTMDRLMQAWIARFQGWHPQVTLRHEGRGSGTAPRALAEGFAHLGPMSRPLTPSERSDFSGELGFEPTQLIVAMDALAIYVHTENPIARRGLTLAELEAIFAVERTRAFPRSIDAWGDLGLEGEWRSAKIDLLGRNPASGSYGVFRDAVMNKGKFKPAMLGLVGSAELIDRIAHDRVGIGFSGIGYIRDDVATVPIARQSLADAILPSVTSAHDGTYPLVRPLYLTVVIPPGQQPTPLQREFLRFVFSKQGQELVASKGFYPLPADMAARELTRVGLSK